MLLTLLPADPLRAGGSAGAGGVLGAPPAARSRRSRGGKPASSGISCGAAAQAANGRCPGPWRKPVCTASGVSLSNSSRFRAESEGTAGFVGFQYVLLPSRFFSPTGQVKVNVAGLSNGKWLKGHSGSPEIVLWHPSHLLVLSPGCPQHKYPHDPWIITQAFWDVDTPSQ